MKQHNRTSRNSGCPKTGLPSGLGLYRLSAVADDHEKVRMADFVAVIRRAVDGLSNNTPEMRVKVYEKARGAVMRQLENMTPKPSEEMLRRQLDKLEVAITDVEAEYAEALPAIDESADVEPAYEPEQPHAPEPEPEDPQPEPYHSEPEPIEEPEAEHVAYEPEVSQPVYDEHQVEPWQAPDYQEPEQHPHEDYTPRMPAVSNEFPEWAREQVAEPEPEAPVAQPAKHAMDSWLDGHMAETAAAKPLAQSDWHAPALPHDEAVHQDAAPAFRTEQAEALGAFDEFVRSHPVGNAKKETVDPVDLLNWNGADIPASPEASARAPKRDEGNDPAWFDDFVTTSKTSVPNDTALQNLTNDTGKRQGVSKDEMSAVLNKGKKKTKARSKSTSGGVTRFVVAGVLVVLLAGGGYAAYVKRDVFSSLISGLTPPAPQTAQQGQSDTTDNSGVKAATSGGDTQAGVTGQKFTQQLLPDGTEVDRGASDAQASSNEGRSVAQQNVAANAPAAPAAAAAPAGKAFTVPANGQKAYLYEERLGETTPVTMQGYIVWEEKRESDDNGKAQPVIQGRLAIPEQGLTALITFKRNTDPSLPASHLAEIVFSVPKTFAGGGIDSVQRIAMKQTEQDRGDPIVAVPAKIIDDSFMIAFNDFAEVVARNVSLLGDREWIDIPVTYRNGRRALITLDKGAVGKQIFDTVIKEWAALGSAKSGG